MSSTQRHIEWISAQRSDLPSIGTAIAQRPPRSMKSAIDLLSRGMQSSKMTEGDCGAAIFLSHFTCPES
jgi:hypothetical protein